MGRKPSGKPSIDRIRRIQKNGYVYVYERTRVLDEETHKYKSSQTLLGRLPDGSEDLYGELLPTRPKRKALNLFVSNPSQPSIPESDKLRTGMIDIVSNICDYSGLYSVFNTILSDEAGIRQKILTCAWYDFASDGDTWPGITNWSTKYQGLLPYSSGPITKNMYHSLFAEIGTREDIKIGLFQKLCDGLEDETLLALDSSTFFTESENLVNARNAVHKDGQIKNVYKIVYFYAINCRKPIAYAIIPGNIPDSETVYNALLQLQMLRLNNVEIVSDNGYCTEPVIALYLEKSQPFLTRIEADIKWISPIIEKNRSKLLEATVRTALVLVGSHHHLAAESGDRLGDAGVVRRHIDAVQYLGDLLIHTLDHTLPPDLHQRLPRETGGCVSSRNNSYKITLVHILSITNSKDNKTLRINHLSQHLIQGMVSAHNKQAHFEGSA